MRRLGNDRVNKDMGNTNTIGAIDIDNANSDATVRGAGWRART